MFQAPTSTPSLEARVFFRNLKAPLYELLTGYASSNQRKKNAYIFLPGEKSQNIYFIQAGRIKISGYSGDGKEVIKNILYPGDILGENCIFGETKRTDFAMALDPEVRYFSIGKTEFLGLLQRCPNLRMELLRHIGSKLQKMEARLEAYAFQDSRSRVIEFIRFSARKRRPHKRYGILLKPFLTHQEIAGATDTSRQTVTTVLNSLKESGYIEFDRKSMFIEDLEKLI